MTSFFARQPIMSKQLAVKAYELLYRSSPTSNRFDPSVNGDAATASILEGFHSVGIEQLANRKRAFVNFPENLLLNSMFTLFPPEYLVVEVLETLRPSPMLLSALQTLHDKGFIIAFDDFVYSPEFDEALRYADIIKLEYSPAIRDVLRQLLPHIDLRKTTLLAERIETQEEFETAKSLGFTLFQGYFFSRPVVLGKPDLTPTKANAMRLMTLAFEPEVNFFEMSRIIRQDLSLSLRILRMVNSVYFGLLHKIRDIHQAVVFLGEIELKKWLSLVTISGLCEDKPNELIRMSLVRARMCEQLAVRLGHRNLSETYFLIGLFSMLDTLMGCPMDVALRDMPLSNDVTLALIRHQGDGYRYLCLIKAVESCAWETVAKITSELGLTEETVSGFYADAVVLPSSLLM